MIATSRIPDELTTRPSWLGYRSEWVEARGKYSKKPISPHDGGDGSSTNPATWGSFDQAVAAVQRLRLDGVGFALCEDDPFTAIDLDGCRNPETGEIEPWARDIVQRFGSYTEVSPSGSGLHIIVAGMIPVSGRRSGQIEVYHSGRYITVTGDVLPGFEEILECGDELAGWFAETFPAPVKQDAARWEGCLSLGDEDILQKIGGAKNGPAFLRLYAGDKSAYGGDHSAADLALVSMLAFYTQDADQIGRIVASSGLNRPKWDRPDYRQRTIDRALSTLTETYTPGRAQTPPPVPARVDSSEDIADNATVAALQTQIAELQDRLRIADAVAMRAVEMEKLVSERDQQLRECAANNAAMRKVLMHPTMAASTKCIGLATLTHLNAREDSPKYTDPELGTRVDMDVIARLSGMGTKTAGKAAQDLDAAGLWKRTEVKWNPPGGGPPITKIWLKTDGTLTERTRALADLEVANRNHGGHREVCEVCGSDDVHRRSNKECRACGHEWEKKTTPLNPPETGGQDDTPLYATNAGGQDDAQRYIDTTGGQDDAPCAPTVDVPSPPRPPVVHFVPEAGDGIDEINPWQGTQPPASKALCRHVFGQECHIVGCKHQSRYVPVGAG
jgi:primase-polymerase (primpol)-like protein